MWSLSGYLLPANVIMFPRLARLFLNYRYNSPLGDGENHMLLRALPALVFATGLFTGGFAQDAPIPQLLPGSARRNLSVVKVQKPSAAGQSVDLTVAKGTPLQVALDRELRVTKAGQSIHGRLVEPIYAFDQIVVPRGAEVTGKITKIEKISGGRRTKAALNADFTPNHNVEIGFTDLTLSDGRHFALQTSATRGPGQTIRFVTSVDGKDRKRSAKDAASEKTREAMRQARQEWDNGMRLLKTPGRLHRLERYVEAQLPVHAQYLSAGTMYLAELEQPLNFGSAALTPEMASEIGRPLPPGSLIHARLVTELSSASAQKGQEIKAVMSEPLFDADHHLILPQGSELTGTVRQVEPAHHWKKNGQLRIVFQELAPPDGVAQKVETTLEGVQSDKDANVRLDSEGGVEATTPKTRYLATAFSLTLAAASMRQDGDMDHGVARSGGDPGARAAGGANGFKLVGIALGLAVRSPALGYAMGAYGAAKSVYSNFIAKGREVVFPMNTAMDIGVGTREEGPTKQAMEIP